MRIGIDARMYGPLVGGGGLGRYVQELVQGLHEIDHDNRYLVFLKKENVDACSFREAHFEKKIADVHWYTLSEQLVLPKIMDREKLDLLHFPHWNVPLRIKTPFVVTIHDLLLLCEPQSAKVTTRHPLFYAMKYRGFQITLAHAIRSAKHIIAVSKTTKQAILEFFPKTNPEKISVIYEGLSPLPTPTPSSPFPFPYFLYVGNAYPHKNLENLIQAFLLFHQTHPTFHLVLAGRKDVFYERLARSEKGQQRSSFILFVMNPSDQELANLYAHAHTFAIVSKIEGFGLPPLEAMAHGIPVLASDRPSLPEILSDAAHFVPAENIQGIAEGMRVLAEQNSYRQSLIEKGRKQIQRYSWKKMAEQTRNIYLSCASK